MSTLQAVKHMTGARDTYAGPDLFETPPMATHALLRHFTPNTSTIWEPACGRGAISEVVKHYYPNVYSSDLHDFGYGMSGVDFITTLKPLALPDDTVIITNPPFNIATQFVSHAMMQVDCGCFLLRLAFLEGQRRKQMYAAYPLRHLLVFSRRLPRMHRPDYSGVKTTSMIAFAWFIFDNNYSGMPTIAWI